MKGQRTERGGGRGSRRERIAVGVLALAIVVAAVGCEARAEGRAALTVAGGDASRGPALMRAYGCSSCHTIPGVAGADSWVGPPLTHWSRRIYIAGLLPNTPENLVAWIYDPWRIHPESAMPRVGASEAEARHMAAYLFTLR
jgi:cytochrome c